MKKEVPRDEFIRKRMERQRRIRKRRLIIFFIFLMVTAICVGITLSLTVFFKIEDIQISGSAVYSSEELLKHSQVETGDNLFVVSERRAENALKKTLPYVEAVKFKRELPATLKITVSDAEEFACYSVANRYFVASESGWVLKEIEEPSETLTTVYATEVKASVGSSISFAKEDSKALIEQLFDIVKKENINLNSIDITEKLSLKLYVENRFEVDLGTNENIDRKIKHLAGMIKNIPSEKSGKINLSMWTTTNTQGTFTEKKGQ